METQLSWYYFIKRPFHHLLTVSLSTCPHTWYLFLWLLLHLSLCLHHVLPITKYKRHKGWHFLQGFMIFVLTFKCVAQFKLNFVNSWIKNFGSLFCMWTFSCPGTEISFFCCCSGTLCWQQVRWFISRVPAIVHWAGSSLTQSCITGISAASSLGEISIQFILKYNLDYYCFLLFPYEL